MPDLKEPIELLAVALASCTESEVITILEGPINKGPGGKSYNPPEPQNSLIFFAHLQLKLITGGSVWRLTSGEP